jgi:hypothetical protein
MGVVQIRGFLAIQSNGEIRSRRDQRSGWCISSELLAPYLNTVGCALLNPPYVKFYVKCYVEYEGKAGGGLPYGLLLPIELVFGMLAQSRKHGTKPALRYYATT